MGPRSAINEVKLDCHFCLSIAGLLAGPGSEA